MRKIVGHFQKIIILINLLVVSISYSKSGNLIEIPNFLKSGDIVLISLRCYYCKIIESETNSNYSHIGMILKENGINKVIDSMGKVQITLLEDFLKRTNQNSTVTFIRHFEFLKNGISSKKLKSVVENKYLGLPYDPYFLLNNSINGKKAYYCSELMEEILSEFAYYTEGYFPLTYQKNFEIWQKYFNRLDYHVPEGVMGNSPESFAQSSFFNTIYQYTIKHEQN